MKKRILSALCMVMLVSLLFTGCSAPQLEGQWQGEIDFTDTLNQQLTAAADPYFSDLQFEDIYLTISMEFTKDGKCILSFDDAAAETMITKLINQMLPVLDAQLEEQGVTFEDLLGIAGVSKVVFLQMLAQQMMQAINLDALKITKNYKAEDGILYIGDSLENTAAMPYTLTGKTLTIEAGDTEGAEWILPLVLTRA